jgi:methionine sulfoxide reductase heme-binding subunit
MNPTLSNSSFGSYFTTKNLTYVIRAIAFLLPLIAYIDPSTLKDMGQVALYALLVVAFTGPITTLWRNGLTKFLFDIRPDLGILMGMAAVTHGIGIMIQSSKLGYLELMFANPWVDIGFFAMILTIPMLLSSNLKIKALLGAWWFRIHKLIYAVVILGVIHGYAMESQGAGPAFYIKTTLILGAYLTLFILAKRARAKMVAGKV